MDPKFVKTTIVCLNIFEQRDTALSDKLRMSKMCAAIVFTLCNNLDPGNKDKFLSQLSSIVCTCVNIKSI